MAWTIPKLDWGATDGVFNADMIRIEGNTLDNHNAITALSQATVPKAFLLNNHALNGAGLNLTYADVGAIASTASCNKNWNWSGQGGQPTWLWGGEDPNNEYLYNPSNFTVNIANYTTYSTHWVGSAGFAVRNCLTSAASPSGGSDGDHWHMPA